MYNRPDGNKYRRWRDPPKGEIDSKVSLALLPSSFPRRAEYRNASLSTGRYSLTEDSTRSDGDPRRALLSRGSKIYRRRNDDVDEGVTPDTFLILRCPAGVVPVPTRELSVPTTTLLRLRASCQHRTHARTPRPQARGLRQMKIYSQPRNICDPISPCENLFSLFRSSHRYFSYSTSLSIKKETESERETRIPARRLPRPFDRYPGERGKDPARLVAAESIDGFAKTRRPCPPSRATTLRDNEPPAEYHVIPDPEILLAKVRAANIRPRYAHLLRVCVCGRITPTGVYLASQPGSRVRAASFLPKLPFLLSFFIPRSIGPSRPRVAEDRLSNFFQTIFFNTFVVALPCRSSAS